MGFKYLFRFFFKGFTRRKGVDNSDETSLDRCLNVIDLTALGVGSTLGAGIYVVAGQVAKDTAGPSVTISFLVAAIASVFAGLCYAEFGSRVPKTGSAYVYSYVTVGELMAFIIGWNLILEYVIGTASVARAWTANFDALINNAISDYMRTHLPMHLPGLAEFPDFFAVALVLLLTVMVAAGVRESTLFNNLFTLVNIMVVLYVVICGCFKLHLSNWQINPDDVEIANATSVVGNGGFFPFGFSGVFSGASTCFFAFIGFDVIATAGEEVKNPQRNIPISIVGCLLICFAAYFSISAIITLMCPFYLLDKDAPLPAVFERVGWPIAKYFIAAGSLCGLSTSMFGGLFPLPRIIYAMASDGLIFRFLGVINDRFKTPLLACVVSGILCSIMTCIFDIKELVDMMSIGTLLAYTLVATSVLLLRGTYIPSNPLSVNPQPQPIHTEHENQVHISQSVDSLQNSVSLEANPLGCRQRTLKNVFSHMFSRHQDSPCPMSDFVNSVTSYFLLLGTFVLAAVLRFPQVNHHAYIIGLFLIFLINFIFVIILAIQPEDQQDVSFKVPLVPWLPAISLLINVYLMMKLSAETWIRFAVWMVVGLIMYFAYGIRNSSEARRNIGLSSYDTI